MFVRTQTNGSRTYLLIVDNEWVDGKVKQRVLLRLLALLLRKELQDRLARKDWKLEWADVIRDRDNLIEMEVTISGKGYVFRGPTTGVAGKVFQACAVALPPALRSC